LQDTSTFICPKNRFLMTMPPPDGNSLMIVDKIPAAWLVQIRDAGHGLMNHYPDQFNKIVSTFLEIVR
jgi:pimeloyl-ACP methyl ester carboxylesterase